MTSLKKLLCFTVVLCWCGWAWSSNGTQIPRSESEWNLGSLELGKVYPTEITAKNLSCDGSHSFAITVEAGPWFKITGPSRLNDIARGASKTSAAAVDLRDLEPGSYEGRISIRCLTCPPTCQQNLSELRIKLIAQRPPAELAAKRPPAQLSAAPPPADLSAEEFLAAMAPGGGPGGPSEDPCKRCCMDDPCQCAGCYCFPGEKCRCAVVSLANESSPSKDLGVLRQFRDQILLKSERGKRFVRLYYFHSPAVIEVFRAEPKLAVQAVGLTAKIAPGLERMLRADRRQARVSRSLLNDIGSFAEALAGAAERHGRPNLASDIRRETKPFTSQHLVDMTYLQAWGCIGGDS